MPRDVSRKGGACFESRKLIWEGRIFVRLEI